MQEATFSRLAKDLLIVLGIFCSVYPTKMQDHTGVSVDRKRFWSFLGNENEGCMGAKEAVRRRRTALYNDDQYFTRAIFAPRPESLSSRCS